ncbi:class 1 isoprenoid biosynthesis enzyme [Thermodesulfobacteriota bacterium]
MALHSCPPPPDYASLEKNFFSALFLYSYHRAGIPVQRRILYAAINQCLRGMVTGCDNLMDDEYKETLLTDLPGKSCRFRSVLDIMVSDRILFEVLFKGFLEEHMSSPQILDAIAASISGLTRSGAQEASEEGGVAGVLQPEQVLESVHHFKTGLLFMCPWSVPRIIEDCSSTTIDPLLDGLYKIGLGCQIMDDMVDLARDTRKHRHNFLASLVYYQPGSAQWGRLKAWALEAGDKREIMTEFPDAVSKAVQVARQYLMEGLRCLFDETHRPLVEPTIRFLSQRIGTEHIMYPV